ncbi:DUF6765 family protein [Desulfolutivibrio sulfoxidireducens]|uniref:DUF6765 family protein n=1 Tax=Desulfolutivibrio sulfoxidireducens TaxID=2773299 RepID=UPI00159E488D|nr:DUF6765 family protein [Desulfolutivibrio sulfoxidireducens]QLA17497.1 hypothetical protein GD605_16120 [Desulfolutivibrio sulfoxidireducens]
MDIEFHYHMTYLIAAKAGYAPNDAAVIAYACQFTDDNIHSYVIDEDNPATRYENYYSQTYDITKPKAELFRVYCVFHFLPGDPMSKSTDRVDGLMHWLNTTPASANAVGMLTQALDSGDLYRLGIACHTYADTFAHQNFIGFNSVFNSLKNLFSSITPNIGHAEAVHKPDRAGKVWEDTRLLSPQVVNKARFLDAARSLFLHLAVRKSPQAVAGEIEAAADELVNDLDEAIGGPDPNNDQADSRIARYQALATKQPYGTTLLPDYDPKAWFTQAVDVDIRGLPDWMSWFPDILPDTLSWISPGTSQQSHWYRFQEAVKDHQKDTLALLKQNTLKRLSLPGW